MEEADFINYGMGVVEGNLMHYPGINTVILEADGPNLPRLEVNRSKVGEIRNEILSGRITDRELLNLLANIGRRIVGLTHAIAQRTRSFANGINGETKTAIYNASRRIVELAIAREREIGR